ncbi:MAG: hypothetical protein RLZZ628_3209 [Bacteroidota bacterium]|jgi:hypothetical protein
MPKGLDRKTKAITFNVSEKDWERLRFAANLYDMTLTDFLLRASDIYMSYREKFESKMNQVNENTETPVLIVDGKVFKIQTSKETNSDK